MRVLITLLLIAIISSSHANSPIPVLRDQEVLDKALTTGISVAQGLGYAESEQSQFYVAGPIFVHDLVELNPYSFGQLYAKIFKLEEINTATLLNNTSRSDWKAILENRSIGLSSNKLATSVAARYSGYHEVPVYHAQDGCTAHVRFLAASSSSWSAADFCPETPMLSELDVQQITGRSESPVLVTFEHTDSGWGKMWLVGPVAVQPYNGEVYVVVTRDGTIVDPLQSMIDLELRESYQIGLNGLVANPMYTLPIQLVPMSVIQAGN